MQSQRSLNLLPKKQAFTVMILILCLQFYEGSIGHNHFNNVLVPVQNHCRRHCSLSYSVSLK